MISQENRLFCRLDGVATSVREQQRMATLTELGLLQTESIPVFEEATQMAAQTLETPICILAVMETDRQRFKSAVGLSQLGLMNELATSRQLPRMDSFCTHVVDSHQPLAISDTLAHPAFANSILVYQYGIRAYLGIPLIASNGCCLGTLAMIDVNPHVFSSQDIAFLELTARWSMSEFERQRTVILKVQQAASQPASSPAETTDRSAYGPIAIANQLRVDLLGYLVQELRTPLTSVMGMASVLTREIYGPLTSKQKEYLNIIHNSGQYLLSLMNEIVELSEFKESNQSLNISSVDIEMLSQKAINTLDQAAQRRGQQIRLTVEPGRRIWLLDKEKVRQMLYHLIFNVMQSSTAGGIVRLHVSRRENYLNFAVWVSHPWLGEGVPYTDIYAQPTAMAVSANGARGELQHDAYSPSHELINSVDVSDLTSESAPPPSPSETHRKNLGLLLSQHLAELHGGRIGMQGNLESGYRYVINLPRIAEKAPNS